MSIIDQILSIEKTLKDLQSEENQDILALSADFRKKKENIQMIFESSLYDEKQKLEAEMYARIELYKAELNDNQVNIEAILQNQLEKEYDRILKVAIDFFWQI